MLPTAKPRGSTISRAPSFRAITVPAPKHFPVRQGRPVFNDQHRPAGDEIGTIRGHRRSRLHDNGARIRRANVIAKRR